MTTRQHALFLDRLASSSRAVFLVAQMQHAKGRTVEIPKTRFAPTAAVAEGYVDGGDLIVVTRHRIEVKHLGIEFTCRDDWPFREAFVSNVAAVERANGDVLAYVSVSRDYQHIAVIPRNTHQHWYIVETKAKNTGNIERFYACPLDHVIFGPTGDDIMAPHDPDMAADAGFFTDHPDRQHYARLMPDGTTCVVRRDGQRAYGVILDGDPEPIGEDECARAWRQLARRHDHIDRPV